MKLIEVELMETQFKTKQKFEQEGSNRLRHMRMNCRMTNAMRILEEICTKVDCNFHEVLDAVNRTTR